MLGSMAAKNEAIKKAEEKDSKKPKTVDERIADDPLKFLASVAEW